MRPASILLLQGVVSFRLSLFVPSLWLLCGLVRVALSPCLRTPAWERRSAEGRSKTPTAQTFSRRERGSLSGLPDGKTTGRVVPVVGLSLLSGEGVSAAVAREVRCGSQP